MKKKQAMIGELERLGPSGRDILVLGVDAPGFRELPADRKIFAYYLYRAAIAGENIAYQQNHRDALEIKQLMETIWLHSDGLDKTIRGAVHDYLKYVWIHHGNYHHYTHHKFLPNSLTPDGLHAAALHALGDGAQIPLLPGETIEDKLARLQPVIFDPNFEPLQTNQSESDDIIATSAANFYDPSITQADIDRLLTYWRTKLNVRFTRVNGAVVPQIYKIGGLYSKELSTICHFLESALPYAETEEQNASLRALIDYFTTGDETLFREYSMHWLKSDTKVDFLNGFIEQYLDPRGIIGSFEANVNFAADSGPVERLADNALYFERKMPWPDEYKRSAITRPVARIVNVIVETGDAGPVSPAAYNLPNYNDIRRDYGSKNVILLNIENSRSESLFRRQVEEFYLPEYRDKVLKYGLKVVRPWEVYMHEIIGHGSGQPDPMLRDDPRSLLGKVYSALEECRADLVALYQIADPKLPEIGAFAADEQGDIAETFYIQYLQGWFSRLDRVEGSEVREAHDRGSHLILMYLVENGNNPENDFGVGIVRRDGDYFVEIKDTRKVKDGIEELLRTLQIIKSTGDTAAADTLFAKFGTAVRPEWKANVSQRMDELAIPKIKAFVFPRLIPVIENGTLVDVEIAYDEDLTAQQLRFSRMQYVTDLVVE
jgi:dipeptidyl-peptidase-3